MRMFTPVKLCVLFLLSFASFAAIGAMDNDKYDKSIETIVWTKSPSRWHSAINPDVVQPLVEDWIRTNAPANRAQELIVARWRMQLNGANQQWDAFEKNYAILCAETNRDVRLDHYEKFIRWTMGMHANTFVNFRIGSRESVKRLLASSGSDFATNRLMYLHEAIAVKGVGIYRDRVKGQWDLHFNAVKAMPDFPPHRARSLGAMINGLFPLGREEAHKEYEKNKSLLDEADKVAYLLAYADACKAANDRENFDRTVEAIKAFKPERRAKPYSEILKQMSSFDIKTARQLIEEALTDTDLTPGDRAVYLECRMCLYRPSGFNYGQNEPGVYETWKKTLIERKALPWFDPARCDGYAGIAMDFEDYAFAEQLVADGLKKSPDSASLLMKRARLRLIERGDRAGAADDYEAASKGKGFPGNMSAEFLVNVAAYLRTKTTPGDSMAAMRQLSRELYNLRLYDECRALQAQWERDLLLPREEKRHTVVFDPDAPRSAEGFVRTKYYDDWKGMETRFQKYGADYHMRAKYDEALSKKNPDIATDPNYPTGVKVIADNDFVHVFIRCDDPAIGEVKTGKRTDAGSLELFFEPGDHEVPYHSIFFQKLPKMEDQADATWAMPDPHYRRTTDFTVKDTVLTDKGVVAHLGIPWIACYDTLPFDGRHWLLGIYRWHNGGGQCFGGSVHALSHGLRLDFPFSTAQITALKKRIAETAYNRYAALRDAKGDYIQCWNDELLGDPEFFAAEVKPLLDELDAKGKTPDIKDAADWAEINYKIASRRTRYLKKKLLEKK